MADANGTISAQASYDSFGNRSGALPTRYGFTGRETDEFTSLMYYRARYYEPQIGRFTGEDPIGLEGGLNLYEYVENNPVNQIDPNGLFSLVKTATIIQTVMRPTANLPILLPSAYLHYQRNSNQNCPPRLPEKNLCPANSCCSNAQWKEYSEEGSVFHDPIMNIKIGGISFGNIGYECVYNRTTKELVTDNRYVGTYNVFPPNGYGLNGNGGSSVGHGIFDVFPYFLWGNR